MKTRMVLAFLAMASSGCNAMPANYRPALMVEAPQDSSRADEALRKFRETATSRPAPAPAPEPEQAPVKKAPLIDRDAPKPGVLVIDDAFLLRHFSPEMVARIHAILASLWASYEFELKSSEVAGKVHAVEDQIEAKKERLLALQAKVRLLSELQSEDGEAWSKEIQKVQAALRGLAAEKSALEKQQREFDAAVLKELEARKRKIVIDLLTADEKPLKDRKTEKKAPESKEEK